MKECLAGNDAPKWAQLRFSGDAVAACFRDGAERIALKGGVQDICASDCDRIAGIVNSLMDRQHNQKAGGILMALRTMTGRNIDIKDIRGELYLKMMDAGGALYGAIEAFQEYGALKESDPFAQIVPLLERVGATHTEDVAVSSQRGRPKAGRPGRPSEDWRKTAVILINYVAEALLKAGYGGDLDATHPNSLTSNVGASLIERAYGRETDADQFSKAILDSKRRRSKRPDPVVKLMQQVRLRFPSPKSIE